MDVEGEYHDEPGAQDPQEDVLGDDGAEQGTQCLAVDVDVGPTLDFG